MTNSLVSHIAGYVNAIFADMRYAYSHDREWSRDKSRLLHELENQGHRVMTLDLPALDKHFIKCLDEGLYTPSHLPYGGKASGNKTPKFLGNLFLQIFHPDGRLRDAPSVDCILSIRQLYASLKKLRLPCEEWRTTDEIKNFIRVELETKTPSLHWSDDDLGLGRCSHPHLSDGFGCIQPLQGDLLEGRGSSSVSLELLRTIQRTADIVFSSLGDFSQEKSSELPKHGPGVVSNQTRKMFKYTFPEWPRKLDAEFPHDLYASPDLGEGFRHDPEMFTWSDNESPSKLIVVPKTAKAPRLIAAEPVQHQWIQQLIWNQLEARSSSSVISKSVNFRSQVSNQEMAVKGSVDGSYATIDLSAASDRLSCWLVERLIRSNWSLLRRLHASRTRWLRNDIRPTLGQYIALRKFAAMGSACTFPVQTLCYASIAVGTVLFLRKKAVSSRSVASAASSVQVFGDDIIVPSDSCELVCEVLTHLGLKVNDAKTFSKGNFRESCGVDVFRGYDVAPTYVLDPNERPSISQVPAVLEVSNNLHRRGWWHAASWASSLLSKYEHMLILKDPRDTSLGLVTYSGGSVDHLRKRWNPKLHREEYRILVPYSTSTTVPDHGVSHLLQYFTERPDPLLEWTSGLRSDKVSSVRPGWSPSYSFPHASDSSRKRWAKA